MADVAKRVIKKIEGGNEGGENLVEEKTGHTEPSNKSGIEHTGFNIIRLIKEHITDDEPIVFGVVHIYAHLPPRGALNRFVFWIFAFIAQLLDMFLYFTFGLLMVSMVLIIILAIMHGTGIDTYVISFIKEIKSL